MARRSNEEYAAMPGAEQEGQDEYAAMQPEPRQPPAHITPEDDSATTLEALGAEMQALDKRMAEVKAEMQRIANVQYANSAKVTQVDHIAANKAATDALREAGKLHGSSRRRK